MAIINSPTFLQPAAGGASGSGDIVGFNVETAAAQSTRYVSWGQPFEQGKVATDAALRATISTQTVPAQMDVKKRHPDGSVRFAVITAKAPAIIAGGVMRGMLALGGTVAPHIAVLAALRSYNVTVTLAGDAPLSLNIGEALSAAIRAKTSSYWLRGASAVQARLTVPVKTSLRLVADVTCYEDGTFLTDLHFRNEYAMEKDAAGNVIGGTLNYSVIITQNGSSVFNAALVKHWYGEAWRRVFHTSGAPTSDTHNIQHDIAYSIKCGVLQNYDLTTGIDDASIDTFASTNIAPLSNPGWYYAMPSGGHRDDIGPMPGWYARWIKCQSFDAAKTALAMANGAGSIPWHHFDRATNDYLSIDKYPLLWIDDGDRAGPANSLRPKPQDTRWYLDNAHAPAVAFVPYVMTGERFYLDEIKAQASRQLLATWPKPRDENPAGPGVVVTGTNAFELRAQVWTFRSVLEAAWACPDNDPSKEYWLRILDHNYEHILTWLIPTWTEFAGDVAGYWYGVYGYKFTTCWQNDYMISVLGMAHSLRPRNNSHPLKMLKWSQNFQVGRFTHEAQGFTKAASTAYQLQIRDTDTSPWIKTWSELGAVNYPEDAWPTVGEAFVPLALMMLATIYNATGNATALAQYNRLKAANLPGTRPADYQNGTLYSQFHIVPVGAGA